MDSAGLCPCRGRSLFRGLEVNSTKKPRQKNIELETDLFKSQAPFYLTIIFSCFDFIRECFRPRKQRVYKFICQVALIYLQLF